MSDQYKKIDENGVPLEGWDEDVRKYQSTTRYFVARFVKTIVALSVLAGLVYLSGIYQSTFFQRTSPNIEPRELPVQVEGEKLVLPLTVVNLVEEDRKDIQSRGEIEDMVDKASRIWDQAQIDLELENYSTRHLKDEEIIDFIKNPYSLRHELIEREKRGVVVFLVHSLQGINGIAFVGGDTIALAEFTSVYNFRVLAHEVGHILGLPHVRQGGRLMSTDASGSKITREEALTAREELKKLSE